MAIAFDLKIESQILGQFLDSSLGPSYTVGYSKESSSLAVSFPPLISASFSIWIWIWILNPTHYPRHPTQILSWFVDASLKRREFLFSTALAPSHLSLFHNLSPTQHPRHPTQSPVSCETHINHPLRYPSHHHPHLIKVNISQCDNDQDHPSNRFKVGSSSSYCNSQ